MDIKGGGGRIPQCCEYQRQGVYACGVGGVGGGWGTTTLQ